MSCGYVSLPYFEKTIRKQQEPYTKIKCQYTWWDRGVTQMSRIYVRFTPTFRENSHGKNKGHTLKPSANTRDEREGESCMYV